MEAGLLCFSQHGVSGIVQAFRYIPLKIWIQQDSIEISIAQGKSA
jgi:hypothetical protein